MAQYHAASSAFAYADKRIDGSIVTNCFANFLSAVTCPALAGNTTSIPALWRRLSDEPKTSENFEIWRRTITGLNSDHSQVGGLGGIRCIRGVTRGVRFLPGRSRSQGASRRTATPG